MGRLCILWMLVASGARAADEPKVYGLTLVPWSKEIEPGRYRSSRDWEGTLKYFREKFRGTDRARFWNEVNLPTVKYVHVQSQRAATGWSGLNIYELPNGEVRMYVLPRPGSHGSTAAPVADVPMQGPTDGRSLRRGAAR